MMRMKKLFGGLGLMVLLAATGAKGAESRTVTRTFEATGIVMELPAGHETVVIRHEAIVDYMAAMTMPFAVRDAAELTGLQVGDEVSFQLHVTSDESWIDRINRRGGIRLPPAVEKKPAKAPQVHPLLHFKFTNELGQAVSLGDFPGQALAITFIYTRCPLPEYCPRLSKNFQEATQKLKGMTNAPSNWHFISISFDPEFDTPASLLAYGKTYQYDPAHWSLLTGPAEQIHALAQACGVTTAPDGGTINHNFRTLIIDASGHLQMVFPTSGDLSGQIVEQIIQAASATNMVSNPAHPQ